jgi:hypothetical protein
MTNLTPNEAQYKFEDSQITYWYSVVLRFSISFPFTLCIGLVSNNQISCDICAALEVCSPTMRRGRGALLAGMPLTFKPTALPRCGNANADTNEIQFLIQIL